MVKWVICSESIAYAIFTFTTTVYKQDYLEGYFKREFLNNSGLSVEHTSEAS